MKIVKRISKILLILTIGLVFSSGIASAEYLGPDRVKPEVVSESCSYGVWVHDAAKDECFKPDGSQADACIDCGWECDPGSPCGKADRYYSLGTKLVEHTVYVTYPEATVASTTNCAAWGDAGWCVQLSSVTITANEPVADKVITLIEGTHNSWPFACAANTCTVNMVEGSNVLAYWALSSFGDSSRMGNLTVLQDTIAPEINASLSGIMGDNGWFVSNAVLSVVFSDAAPGSGLAMTSALFNGVPTDVSSPVTITDGVYDIQLDTRDTAGWTASTAQMVHVDTTAPVITANQPAVEVSNSDVTGGGYMNGSVVFTGTYSDPTSGIRVMEVSPDGSHWYAITLNADGTWTYDWDSSQAKDGSYTPLVYAIDYAGNRTDITMQPITLDNSAPAMSMTGGWYIWDSGHIVVYDNRVGIARIELSVRDDQGRWPAREWDYDTSKLEMDLQWDRKFGDGTTAPTGTYEVLLQAWDKLGNGRWITGRIYIPEAGATAVIPIDIISAGIVEATPTPMAEQTKTEESGIDPVVPAAPAAADPAPTATLQPSSTPSSLSFSSVPIIPASGSSKGTTLPVDPNLLTGAAALAAAAAATAYSLQKKAEMDAEIKRREAQSRAEAMAEVREAQLVKEANAFAYNMLKKSGENTISAANKDTYEDYKKYYLANTSEPMNEEEQLALEKYLLSLSAEAYAANVQSQEITLSENDIRRYSAETARYQGLADEYYQQQAAADERAEQAARTQSYYASQIAAYQERKAREASEYSNQVNAFHEGEKASIKSYNDSTAAEFDEKQAKYEAYYASALAGYKAKQKATDESRLTKMEEATEDKNVITPTPHIVSDSIDWYKKYVGNALSIGADTVVNVGKAIWNAPAKIMNKFIDSTGEIKEDISEGASEIREEVTTAINDINESLDDFPKDVLNTLVYDPGNILNTILNTPGEIIDMVSDTTHDLKDIVSNTSNEVKDTMVDATVENLTTAANLPVDINSALLNGIVDVGENGIAGAVEGGEIIKNNILAHNVTYDDWLDQTNTKLKISRYQDLKTFLPALRLTDPIYNEYGVKILIPSGWLEGGVYTDISSTGIGYGDFQFGENKVKASLPTFLVNPASVANPLTSSSVLKGKSSFSYDDGVIGMKLTIPRKKAIISSEESNLLEETVVKSNYTIEFNVDATHGLGSVIGELKIGEKITLEDGTLKADAQHGVYLRTEKFVQDGLIVVGVAAAIAALVLGGWAAFLELLGLGAAGATKTPPVTVPVP